MGLFPMYSGPWSSRFEHRTFLLLLTVFFIVTLVAGWAAWLIWNGSKAGAILSLIVLPLEVVFWIGFALPIPWLIGIARVALLIPALNSFD
jgi:hypothetical protein